MKLVTWWGVSAALAVMMIAADAAAANAGKSGSMPEYAILTGSR